MTNILVVDDSEADRRLAAGILRKHPDWTVYTAEGGHDALEQIEMHIPDVVLTDLQMPLMNGLELVDKIRADYPMLPVILMTNKGSEEIAVRALQRGAASYVAKRNLAQELRQIVERVMHLAVDARSQTRLMRRMARNESTFVLDNDITLIPAVVSYLQGIVSHMRSCEETERLRIGVALEEALLNAYYHGNMEVSSELRELDHACFYDTARERSLIEPYCRRQITVEARVTPQESIYVVRDEGNGFDPTSLPDPTDPANIDRASGRGLLLMQTFMDEVQYNETGNQVTMIKRRSPQPVPVGAGA